MFAARPWLHDARLSSDIELFANITSYDMILSIDSWTKYVAAWYNVPQVIIVPDLRRNYCGFQNISAKQFVSWWLHGIWAKQNTMIIGINESNGLFNYSLNCLDELSPCYVHDVVENLCKSALS